MQRRWCGAEQLTAGGGAWGGESLLASLPASHPVSPTQCLTQYPTQPSAHCSTQPPRFSPLLNEQQRQRLHPTTLHQTPPHPPDAPLPSLHGVVPNYKRIAARKLLFFHGKNGSVRIKDLVNSQVLQELMEMKMSNLQDNQLMGNWFSHQVGWSGDGGSVQDRQAAHWHHYQPPDEGGEWEAGEGWLVSR